MRRYERLEKKLKECFDSYKESKDSKYLIEADCIEHFLYDEDRDYKFIRDFAKERNFKRVVDIGCAMGHQSEEFLDGEVGYVGIDEYRSNFWNGDKFEYIVNRYPFKFEAKEGDLAVSKLCLTWNCYLYEGEKTMHEQLKALSRDFDKCLLYIPKENVEIISKYFKNYEILKDSFVYFYK